MHSSPHAFAVFSFERGPWLRNCVASIERHAPGSGIVVYDDASRDGATLDALRELGARHRVVVAGPGAAGPAAGKVGGLYANMQRALDDLPDGTLFTFMQDDGQLVRAVEASDLELMHGWFDADPRHAFMQHTFLRGYRRRRDASRLHVDAAGHTYAYDASHRGGRWGRHFAAILTSRTDRLRDAGFRFAASEKANDALAATLFAPRALLRDPFAADLPGVPALRHRTRTLGARLADRLDPPALHRIEAMSPETIARLRGRGHEALPFAEDFLGTVPRVADGPWRYGPFQDRRLCKHLHRAEIGLRRIAGRIDPSCPTSS